MHHLPDPTPPDPHRNEIFKQIVDLARKNPTVAIILALSAVLLSSGGIRFQFGDGGCIGVCVSSPSADTTPQPEPLILEPEGDIQKPGKSLPKQSIEEDLNSSFYIWLEDFFSPSTADGLAPLHQDSVSSPDLNHTDRIGDVLSEFLALEQSSYLFLLESDTEEQLSQSLSDRGNPYMSRSIPEAGTLPGILISGLMGVYLIRQRSVEK